MIFIFYFRSTYSRYCYSERKHIFQVWVKLSSYVRGCHYEVMGLEHKRKYHFRVRAENKYGVGAPLDTDRLVTAKYSFGIAFRLYFDTYKFSFICI